LSWRADKLATGRVIQWLSLAAAPAFAVMAVAAAAQPAGMPGLCTAMPMPDPSPLTGMVPMYVLMSVVHVTPWLKLLARRRRDDRTALPRH
jgi:hypothetical protein